MADAAASTSHEDLTEYFAGRKLYGDDFTPRQIAQWHEDEREAYADLLADQAGPDEYWYHALNVRHGYSRIPGGPWARVLGLGSARGEEFLPVIGRVRDLTIVDPSDRFVGSMVGGVRPRYIKPTVEGVLPFADGTFDLLTCFGVLHHIPNVSFVLREMFRVLGPGGHALVREPVASMGDWRRPRHGMTRRERGIPPRLFREAIRGAGFSIEREAPCMFRPALRVPWLARRANTPLGAAMDEWLSRLFAWNATYHATHWWQKIRPACRFFVLRRPDGHSSPGRGGTPTP
jgi:SAM-dependent methyltransferase